MVRGWITGLVISFVMRQIAKWQTGLDWAKVRADLEERVRALVPGEMFDQAAVDLVMGILDAVQSVLAASKDLERIVRLAVDGKYQEAWVILRQLILDQMKPVTAIEVAVYKCVEDCDKI
jgi:hypothetical protein